MLAFCANAINPKIHAFFCEVLKEHTKLCTSEYNFFCEVFKKHSNMYFKASNPVAIAMGFHLFPYRTQQLSPYTPKVLAWKRAGRIGSCRLRKRALIY